LLVRRKYRKISATELVVVVVLYVIFVLLFTEPIVNLVKSLLS
jgi:Sec-independent protein translocase protein TatA